MSSPEKITAVLILDIIGRPKEFLVESLTKIIEEMKQEQGTKVISDKIKEPTTMKENAEFFTTFAEVEVETDDIMYLTSLMFKYMPAHIEVVSPEKIMLSNNEWGDILSELARRLHSYDEVARVIQSERGMLLQKLQVLQAQLQAKQGEKETEKPKEKKAKAKKLTKKPKKK